MYRRSRRHQAGAAVFALLAAVLTPVVAAGPAHAALPGPNGKMFYVADTDGDNEIYSMNPDGTGSIQLTSNTADDGGAVASADGTKLAFISDRTGSPQLWTMNADGTGQTQVASDGITPSPSLSTAVSWSPDGRIFYAGEGEMIMSVNPDGTGSQRLGMTGSDPAVSPDGSKLVWLVVDPDAGTTNAWIGKSDGSTGAPLTQHTEPQTGLQSPEWAPGSDRIAFVRNTSGSKKIVTYTPDGASFNEYATGLSPVLPQWSPDDAKMAYVQASDNTLHTLRTDDNTDTVVRTMPTSTAGPGLVTDWAAASTAPEADIAVTLTARAPLLLAGAITYTLTATNNGPGALTSGTVTTKLPPHTTSVTGLPTGCTYTAATRTVTCTVPALAPTAGTQNTFRANLALLTVGIPLNATATRTASSPADPNPANDQAKARCNVVTGLLILC